MASPEMKPKRPGTVTMNEPWRPSCETCLAHIDGECRFNPPLPLFEPETGDLVYAHPLTPEDHFCLAWAPIGDN